MTTQNQIFKKDGNLKKNVEAAFDIGVDYNETHALIRTCKHSGKGRFTSVSDQSHYIKALLGHEGIRYSGGNDAPRGGATGNYIQIPVEDYISLREKYGIGYAVKVS